MVSAHGKVSNGFHGKYEVTLHLYQYLAIDKHHMIIHYELGKAPTIGDSVCDCVTYLSTEYHATTLFTQSGMCDTPESGYHVDLSFYFGFGLSSP